MPPRKPKRADPELVQAQAALTSGDFRRASMLFRGIVQKRPRLADAHYGLGLVEPRVGNLERGLAHMRQAVQLDGATAIYHYALGGLLNETGELEAAAESFARAGWLDTSLIDCHVDAASVLEQLGRIDEAKKAIARALKADPAHARARVLSTRIALQNQAPDEEALRGFRDEMRPIAASHPRPLERSLAWQALGDINDKLADATAAFEAFARGNDLERELQPIPSDDERETRLKVIDSLAASVTPLKTARWLEEAPDDGLPDPALLVGFPRSGTTMTERALDAHPRVTSLEEASTFESAKGEMARLLGPGSTSRPFHEAIDELTADHVAHLRRFYWDRVAIDLGGAPEPGVILLDKLPIRIAELAFVNRLFPGARVLVALRDPRDVCLSCFRQRFRLNLTMSFFLDLDDTGRLYAHVMRGWLTARESYSFPWLEMRYEDVVTDFEGRMREMLEFLGLEWNDAVLSFHERAAKRLSRTPSYHAVRKAVNTKAVGRWKNYAEGLGPILPVLEPFVEAFGYEK